ncbi:MAG: PAS domain S-box protein [Hydrogenophaga sp.]|nr:PAS domain S-box protein [Hydrogenophaga sp.]
MSSPHAPPAQAQVAALAPPLPSAATSEPGSGHLWLRLLTAAAMGLLVLLTAVLLLAQREAALERAGAQAQREVKRLAAELEASLRMARASIDMAQPSPLPAGDPFLGDHRPLVESLNLPFSLRPLEQTRANPPARQWLPGLAREDGGQWHVPLVWHHALENGNGRATYELLLPRNALLNRFASEGLPAGSSMSLFRIEDDGATTVLVRYPLIEADQGRKLQGHLARAVAQAPSGVFQAAAMIDGIPRIVGYQRLSSEAGRLMVVYALPVEGVLAAWTALLPVAVALALLVIGVMTFGAWRLERAIHQLRRSERHFQTLTDHMPDVVVRYGPGGRVLYANPAIETANGLKPEAMTGRVFEEVGTPPELARQWLACLERVFETGVPETLYFSYPGPQGERHWEAQVRCEPVAPGEAPTALVITRDITERVVAESRRQSAQRLFEAVFQSAPEAMSLGDWTTGQLLLVNDAFCTLFGRPREELLVATSTELGLWRSGANRQQLLAALERGEPVRDVPGRSVRPDGQDIHVRYSAERVVVDDQPRLLLLFRDVTQLEQEQRAVARSELRFRLAAAQGQVWEWDFGRGFIQPSDEFFLALGHSAPSADEMGAFFLSLIHPDDLPRLQQVLGRFLKGEAAYRLEFRARDAQGVYHWFDTRGDGLRDENGRVVYLAGTTFDISERKALEEAQRQTLALLDTIANASPALIWTSGIDQRADWINDTWLAFTGRRLEQEVGSGWLQGMHPDDHAQCLSTYNQAFEAREPYSIEYRLRHHSGEYRWLLEQARPRYDADGQFLGFIGSCLDLTELRQAEAMARERGAILEQVFDVLQDMLFVVDEHERFVHFQAGRQDQLLSAPDQFLGRQLADVMPPHTVGLLREAMARAREHGLQEIDYSLPLPDALHDFNARLAWLGDNGHCMFLVRDVTEQQAAHRDRERLNAFVLLLFRLASHFINLPVQQADSAINEALGDMGRFLDADRAYLFNYDFAAGTASNTHEWCAQGVTPEMERLQNFPLAQMPDWVTPHRLGQMVCIPDTRALPEGPLRELLLAQAIQSLVALPLMDGDRCLGFVGLDSVHHTHRYDGEEATLLQLFAQMLVNIRLRVVAEDRIRELTEGLEHKVAERTAQLEDSVQQLKTVNRELESFTYSASHDLRTPLRGIEGFSSLLLEDHAQQLDESGREHLRRIQKATLHMSQLVSDLLAYSRLQNLSEPSESIDLTSHVLAVLVPFQDELSARHGEVRVLVPPGLAVRAHPQGLTIVLRNLLDNALKFTPADRAPQIDITARQEADRVHLSVSDQGMGFDMRHHDKIFGMFQRLHRQDQIPGTGIGLAMVHKAVERMGGRIRAESVPGQGASFHVELPAA